MNGICRKCGEESGYTDDGLCKYCYAEKFFGKKCAWDLRGTDKRRAKKKTALAATSTVKEI